jgi:NTE family protein
MNEFRNPKKLGLALGGGGARGLAHIGILKVLENAGIQPDLLVGTSMGGMIAAMYAAGVSPADMEAEALRRSSTRQIVKLVDINPSVRGLMKGVRIYNLLADTLGPDLTFADLNLPVAMLAVDVREGKVTDAVRATISVPGVFVPFDLPPYRLIDGGVLNNVPVDITHQMGAEIVIAVDVMPDFQQNQAGEAPVVLPLDPPRLPQTVKDIAHILYVMISAMTNYHLKIDPPDLLLRPDIPNDLDILMSFDRPDEAVAAGEKAAQEALPQIQALLRV